MAGPMAALLILPLMLHTATGETDMELSHQEDLKLCLEGSEYWCRSEETASLCMKEDYCMGLWQNVAAEDTINGAVDSMCDEVDDSIAEICATMKENNKDDLVEAVKNGDCPNDICTQLQMCGGQELGDSEGAPVPAPSVGPACIFCQAFISFVKPLLTDNVHKKDIGQVLADFCMEHFGNSTTCNNFLSTYGQMVKHVLLKPWDEVTTCQEVGACEAGIPMPQFDVKRAASRRKDLEDTRSTQLVMVNA